VLLSVLMFACGGGDRREVSGSSSKVRVWMLIVDVGVARGWLELAAGRLPSCFLCAFVVSIVIMHVPLGSGL